MNSESPLKTLKRHATTLAVSYLLIAQATAVALGADMVLKGESDIRLLSLNHQVGTDAAKKLRGISAANAPAEGWTQRQTTPTCIEDASTVQGLHLVQWTAINHRNLNAESVGRSNGTGVSESLVNRDAALSIEQTSEVDIVHGCSFHQGIKKISSELGGHPMPGPSQDAEGQYRTKQEGFGLPGVRNEQGLDPKGKVCSELMGNHENEAEMTSSCVENTTQGNRFDYQKTCNVPVRFVRPGGQGGTADPTWEALEYMGRPWYWDRQCPTGRAYFLRNDDTYFMVDDRFLFKWTGDLTYPDQMAFTRLCGLRFFLKTDRRMFQAVVDGVTA